MHTTNYRHAAIACAALLLLCGPGRTRAVELHRDSAVTNGGFNLGATELFGFCSNGSCGGVGVWDWVEITASNPTESNQMGGLVAVNATQGGHGLAMHIDYNPTTGFPGHGLLQPGNVIRTSAWVALDPNSPLNRQDFQFALIKVEFYNKNLGAANSADVLFDSDIGTGGTLVQRYDGLMTVSNWTQVVFNYTYSPGHFNAALLEEMRPVVIQGDFAQKMFDGNSVVDGLIVEIFSNATAAANSPVDTTYPGILPEPFVFVPIEILETGRTNTTFVSFDGQPGVEYSLEYSETGPGGPWLPTGLEVSGNGTRQTVTDPAGPSAIRTYRMTVIDPDFEEPL